MTTSKVLSTSVHNYLEFIESFKNLHNIVLPVGPDSHAVPVQNLSLSEIQLKFENEVTKLTKKPSFNFDFENVQSIKGMVHINLITFIISESIDKLISDSKHKFSEIPEIMIIIDQNHEEAEQNLNESFGRVTGNSFYIVISFTFRT